MADSMRIIRRLKNLNPPVGIYFECENLNTLDEEADKWLLQWCRTTLHVLSGSKAEKYAIEHGIRYVIMDT